jgi:hypothetical protein
VAGSKVSSSSRAFEAALFLPNGPVLRNDKNDILSFVANVILVSPILDGTEVTKAFSRLLRSTYAVIELELT